MKTKSQLRDSIIAIALLMVAVVGCHSIQQITHANNEAFQTKNTKTTKAGTKPQDTKTGASQNPPRSTRANSGKESSGNVPDGNPVTRNPGNGPANDPTLVLSVEQLKQNLQILKDKSISRDDLWPLDVLVNPIGLLLIVLAVILGLFLHLVQFIRLSSVNNQIAKLTVAQTNLMHSVRSSTGLAMNPAFAVPPVNPVVEKIADQVKQLQQSLNDLANRCNQIANQITITNSQYRDAAHAVAQTANWIGQTQLEATMAANGGEIGESERAAAIAMLESYREPLRSNANRVDPITQALRELSEKLPYRSHSSPQVTGRIQNLYDGIARFDQQLNQVTTQLESLQRGSFAERSARLQSDQERLFDQVNNGSLSVGQMVQQSRSLIESHCPAEQKPRNDEGLSLQEQEANLKKGIDDAGEYLMDWYNNLFQLQAQLNQSQGSQADAETAAELSRIQQLAREALNRFDIQPEAIQIGQTSFDRRLHEATLVRPAPQYPINTVIDVQKCGFRRMTTGEVLRRPEVVVAGTTA